MRGMGALMGVVVLCGLGQSIVGCFPPALPQADADSNQAEDSESPSDVAEPDDTAPETTINTIDTSQVAEVDSEQGSDVAVDVATDADTSETSDTTEPAECTVDGECTASANPPCVAGRCNAGRCAAVNVSVPCDDGDVCTTADQCQQGVCGGRAFTEAESKNWFIQISGPGDDAAVAVAPHPSGDSLIAGAFTGSVTLSGGPVLQADGVEADAFLLRVTPRGQVLRAIRLGTEHRDIAVSVSPAEHVAQVVVGLNSLDVQTGQVSSSVVWVNDNGTVRATLPVPGRLVRVESFPDGLTLVLLEFTGDVELELSGGGGQISFVSNTRNALVLAMDLNGVHWAKRLSSAGDISAMWLTLNDGGVRLAFETTEQSVHFGTTPLGMGGILLELDDTGAYISHISLDGGVIYPSGFSRGNRTSTFLRFDNAGLGEFFPQAEVQFGQAPGCTLMLPFAPETEAAAWGFGRAWTKGFFVHGLAVGNVDFGGATLEFGVRSEGFFASYDSQCQLRAVWPSPLLLLDNGPASLRFAATDIDFYMGSSSATISGGVTLASTVKTPKSLGPDFDDVVVTPAGGSDGLIGGYTASRALGCAPR